MEYCSHYLQQPSRKCFLRWQGSAWGGRESLLPSQCWGLCELVAVGMKHQLSTHLYPCSSFPWARGTVVSSAGKLRDPLGKATISLCKGLLPFLLSHWPSDLEAFWTATCLERELHSSVKYKPGSHWHDCSHLKPSSTHGGGSNGSESSLGAGRGCGVVLGQAMCWFAVLEPLHPGWHLLCWWQGTAGLLLKHASAQHLPKQLFGSSLLCSTSSPGPVLRVKFTECTRPLLGWERNLLNELLPPSLGHAEQRFHWMKSSTLYNHLLPCWPFQMLISYILQTNTGFLIDVLLQAAPLHGDGALPWTAVSAGLPQATGWTRFSPGIAALCPRNPFQSRAQWGSSTLQ